MAIQLDRNIVYTREELVEVGLVDLGQTYGDTERGYPLFKGPDEEVYIFKRVEREELEEGLRLHLIAGE